MFQNFNLLSIYKMVELHFHRKDVIKNPEQTIQKVTIDLYREREKLIDRLKNKKIEIATSKTTKECGTFVSADLTHFTYYPENHETLKSRAKRSLLQNLILS
jgi:hypothetical protein